MFRFLRFAHMPEERRNYDRKHATEEKEKNMCKTIYRNQVDNKVTFNIKSECSLKILKAKELKSL